MGFTAIEREVVAEDDDATPRFGREWRPNVTDRSDLVAVHLA